MQGIYCIENIITNVKYFGSSINIENRLSSHKTNLLNNKHHNLFLQRSVNKYGIKNFKFYVIEKTNYTTRKDLLVCEQTYLDDNNGGFNMAPASGGDILSNHPNKDDIIKQIQLTINKRYGAMTSNQRKEVYGKNGEKNSGWKGGVASGNTVYKICPSCKTNEIHKNSNICGPCRDRTGTKNPFHGKCHTEETKAILREKMSGDNSWIKGIDPSKLPYTKKYMITYPNGNTKIVYGLKCIAKEFNTSIENVHATIYRIAQGKIPKRGVFKNIIICRTPISSN
jgi:group I intron endonuclease